MNWFKHMVTGIDNQTVDVARVMWIVGVLSFLCFAGYEVYKSGHFDMSSFSLAYAGLMAGGAGSVKLKESTEPKPNEDAA